MVVGASRGEPLLAGLLLGLATGAAVPAAATVLAMAAALVRWGAFSLDALAGTQAVLGPAAVVGTRPAAASAWCAAGALVLASRAPRPVADALGPLRLVAGVPFGLAAAAVLAGPGPGGDLGWRVAASVGGSAIAVLIVAARGHRRSDRALGVLAAGLAVAALALAGMA